MKLAFQLLILSSFLFISCHPSVEDVQLAENLEWQKRSVKIPVAKVQDEGSTYLGVYSQVYSKNAHNMVGLTVTVSLRNTHNEDTAYVLSTKYYDTHGKMIRNYFEKPIYILPMETLQIIIPELDIEGGSGGNFIIDWAVTDSKFPPIFDAVMISTLGQQGLSFTSHGLRLN